MLDTYNQQIHNFVSCTIRTNINTANHHFIVETPKIIQVGYVNDGKHQHDFIQSEDGICRCIISGGHEATSHSLKTLTSITKDCMVKEPKIRQMGRGFNKDNLHNICPTITSNSFECNNFVINYIPFIPKTIDVRRLRIELYAKHNNIKNYRIRKLTPRECFRLMGVDDADIDKIQAAGISNSQQYKMAGNSIVVDNLYHIFRTMFVDKPTKQVKQLTLF